MKDSKKTTNSETIPSDPVSGIDSTVGSFASRMKRKLQEQAELDSESLRARETRQSLILNAMTNIRRALQETCKIELGDRFSFGLETGDWEGWPRVELRLVDALTPETTEHALIVTANDRKETGTISIDTKTGKRLGQMHLQEPDEFPRIQIVLKRALRDFLDTVGAYILNPRQPSEVIECQTKPIETGSFDVIGTKLSHEELFSDEDNYSPSQNTVAETDESAPVAPSSELTK